MSRHHVPRHAHREVLGNRAEPLVVATHPAEQGGQVRVVERPARRAAGGLERAEVDVERLEAAVQAAAAQQR